MSDHNILDDDLLTENTPPEILPPLAGFWTRVGASLVDFLVMLPITGLGVYNLLSIKSLPLAVICMFVQPVYKIFMEGQYGATLGKMATHIKVLGTDYAPIDMNQAVKRYSIYGINFLLSAVTTILLFSSYGFEEVTNFLTLGPQQAQAAGTMLNLLSQLSGLLVLVSVIFVAFDIRKQALHDKIAGTLVVTK
ncbi:MAG: RDD family protein [Lewinellaceae bacterium]|nr:RDD family protein [Lewinella sp.]MCB9280318.1 RDD family protein [Lewinellaceae bacterium]